jgi:hypothetical protein
MHRDLVTVAPADVFYARMVRRGRAPRARGIRAATIPVHAPTRRAVYQVIQPGVLRLGPHVDDFRALGYTVTTLEDPA